MHLQSLSPQQGLIRPRVNRPLASHSSSFQQQLPLVSTPWVTPTASLAATDPTFEGWFRKKEKLNAAEAGLLADLITKETSRTPTETERLALVKAIQFHKPAPGKATVQYGILYPDGKVNSPDLLLTKLAPMVKSAVSAEAIPKSGLPLVLTIRDDAALEVVQDYLVKDVIPTMQFIGQVHRNKGKVSRFVRGTLKKLWLIKKDSPDTLKPMNVHETAAWPLFHQIISGEALPEKLSPLAEKMKQLPIFRLKVGQVSPEAEAAVQKAYEPIKIRLAAIETARMHYTERVDIKEVLSSLTKGALVGGVGETLIHTVVHDGGVTAGAMRASLLVGVDAVDNIYGEMGVLHSDLEANGLKMSKKTIFGTDSWWQIIKNRFKMSGPGGIFAKRAAAAALKGAGTGAMVALPVGFTLSDPTASVATRVLVGGPGTIGTATAIPFNIRATVPQVYYTIRHLMNEGKISVPEDIKNNPAKLKKYARAMAEQELLSRLGFNASMKAFSLVPLSGGILALEGLGVPREALQIIFMGVAPAMENVMRLGLTVKQLKVNNPRNMAKAEEMVAEHGGNPLNAKGKNRIKRLFADRWSWTVNKALTLFPWPVRLPEAQKLVPDELPATEAQESTPATQPALPPAAVSQTGTSKTT